MTDLPDDERILRESVLEFARKAIPPHVRDMDQHASSTRRLSSSSSRMGLMGIEVPDAFGGGGGSFFHSVLAVEALAQVDPSVAVLVDVQNTLVVNAAAPLGQRGQEAARSSQRSPRARSAPTRSPRPDRAATRSPWRRAPSRRGDGFASRAASCGSPTATRRPLHRVRHREPGRGLPRHHGVPRRARGRRVHRRQEGGQARHPCQQHLRTAPRGLPGDRVARPRRGRARATRSPSRRSTRGGSASARR